VVLGAGDGPCGNLGAGVFREGSAYIYLGTSSWISSTGKELVCDPGMVLFNICSVDPAMNNVYGTMQMGGGSFLWLRDTICMLEAQRAVESHGSAYEYMTEEAAASPPGARSLLFLPYLRGERSPRWNPDARGAFLGLTAHHTRADLIRAVMEGVAFNLRVVRDTLRQEHVDVTQMRVTGGGAESSLWRQIFADIFNERIHISSLREAANPLGAALIAGVGVGIFEDFSVVEKLNPVTGVHEPVRDPEIRERYDFLYERFNESYTLLLPLFGKL
jgi:xylulokinase